LQGPPADPKVGVVTWPRGTIIHRVHRRIYEATTFNPSSRADARFSPIVDSRGAVVPALYAGSTFQCAAMESVFRDAPFTAGLKIFPKSRLRGHVHSVLRLEAKLTLCDLSSIGLRKLGLRRSQLIDTERETYTDTRAWAQVIYTANPRIQGLRWVSRQDDRAYAAIFFGDRIPVNSLRQVGRSRGLLTDISAYLDLLRLATRVGVELIDEMS
jgi:hypothetical protein